MCRPNNSFSIKIKYQRILLINRHHVLSYYLKGTILNTIHASLLLPSELPYDVGTIIIHPHFTNEKTEALSNKLGDGGIKWLESKSGWFQRPHNKNLTVHPVYTIYSNQRSKIQHSFFKYAIYSNFLILFSFLKVVTATTKLFSFTTSESPSGVEQH